MDFGMPFLLENNSIEESAALCQRLRLSFVELNANFPACQRLEAAMLRELAACYGIYFTLHIEEECDPFAFNRRVREAWKETVCDAICLAKETNMPLVNMHLPKGVYITLPDQRVFLYRKNADEYHNAILAFRGMVEEAVGDSGVRVSVENTSGFAPHELAALETLLESPVFGLTLDIGHSHGVGDMDIPFYEKHTDRLIHMHGHDALGKRNHLALGDGEIDLPGRFAWAARNGARVVLETKTIAALETSVSCLPEILAHSGEKV